AGSRAAGDPIGATTDELPAASGTLVLALTLTDADFESLAKALRAEVPAAAEAVAPVAAARFSSDFLSPANSRASPAAVAVTVAVAVAAAAAAVPVALCILLNGSLKMRWTLSRTCTALLAVR